jgi:hypothetical protein
MLSTDEWIKKMWYGVLFSHKNQIMLSARKWVELEIIMLSKISLPQKDEYHVFSHTHTIDPPQKKLLESIRGKQWGGGNGSKRG